MRFHFLTRLSERSKRIHVLFKYYNNLFIYKTQKSIDYLWYGKPRQSASVPFMITARMTKSLHSLGYKENDIKTMTPLQASNIIKNGKKRQSGETSIDNEPGETKHTVLK